MHVKQKFLLHSFKTDAFSMPFLFRTRSTVKWSLETAHLECVVQNSKQKCSSLPVSSHAFADLMYAVDRAGIEVIDVLASPIAASVVTLTKAQKIAGCVLANIGAETISVVVYENNIPISLEVFPIGSTDITHDIALRLEFPIEEAENIKMGVVTATSVSRKKLDEIVNARLSDMFELIEAHLKKSAVTACSREVFSFLVEALVLERSKLQKRVSSCLQKLLKSTSVRRVVSVTPPGLSPTAFVWLVFQKTLRPIFVSKAAPKTHSKKYFLGLNNSYHKNSLRVTLGEFFLYKIFVKEKPVHCVPAKSGYTLI